MPVSDHMHLAVERHVVVGEARPHPVVLRREQRAAGVLQHLLPVDRHAEGTMVVGSTPYQIVGMFARKGARVHVGVGRAPRKRVHDLHVWRAADTVHVVLPTRVRERQPTHREHVERALGVHAHHEVARHALGRRTRVHAPLLRTRNVLDVTQVVTRRTRDEQEQQQTREERAQMVRVLQQTPGVHLERFRALLGGLCGRFFFRLRHDARQIQRSSRHLQWPHAV